MPPSHRSSSSHSSSRSHSSHSSSRSHSSRSYSSHSSRSSYGSYGTSSRSSSTYQKRTAPPPARRRTNQPTGCPSTNKPLSLRGASHDYVYYPSGWTDTATGKYYDRGYYDETGKHYENVAIKKGSEYETICCCDYCGTSIKLKWKEGALPSCPNCGALLSNITQNVFFDTELKDQIISSSNGFGKNITRIVIGSIVACCLLPFLTVGGMGILSLLVPFIPDETTTTTTTRSTTLAPDDPYNSNTIYVDVLGRNCNWDSEYECYYDEPTDCYFVFNTDVEPPEWQYWYEGISSDYGDYGWMTYDYDEERWYIESSSGWDVLPDSYDVSDLWYMNEEGTGKYDGQNTIHVESIDRDCEWIPAEAAYYDPDTDCYFIYNDYVEPPVWQFWYGGISDAEEFEGYGWMEYDFDEDRWYIETEGGWEALPDSYDVSDLWYIE